MFADLIWFDEPPEPLPAIFVFEVRCLYCQKRTGSAHDRERFIVCGDCRWGSHRDEAREVAAGMGPWAKPQSELAKWLGHKAIQEVSGNFTAPQSAEVVAESGHDSPPF